MRIADSTVNMLACRNYMKSGIRSGGYAYDRNFASMANLFDPGKESTGYRDSYESGSKKSGMSFQNTYDIGYFMGTKKIVSGKRFGTETGATFFQNSTLSALFRRFAAYGMTGGFSGRMVAYSETEETAFAALGQARTEDGRIIDFNVNILMSRSYMEYMNVQIPAMADTLFDPLVVNIGTDTANVRDQTFRFDLDADGKEDEISMLGKGSGFLALDKDENGRIDDGNELFGTKSGDGFGELRSYDSDGNGWIDENDEIFGKLKVWCKDETGRDILMDLKEADVGAIFLGEQQTEFTMGGADGIRDGVLRSTGVFLKESGGAGTIQHLDLVMKQNGQGEKVSGEQTSSYSASSSANTEQSNSARRREEARRRNERARRKKAEAKAAEEARIERKLEQKKYEQKLQEKRLYERLQRDKYYL